MANLTELDKLYFALRRYLVWFYKEKVGSFDGWICLLHAYLYASEGLKALTLLIFYTVLRQEKKDFFEASLWVSDLRSIVFLFLLTVT